MNQSSNNQHETQDRMSRSDSVSIGTVLTDRYQIVSYLGRGGMSTVYKALDMKSGRTVAIKILHAELLSDSNRVQRFMQEAKTYRNLRHKHIVKTYDFFQDDESRYCLIMEYHEGRNLAQVLAESGRLTIRRAVKVFSEICDALEHAHAQGIVHRDLKPSNIALVEQESDIDYVKVLDFGIAKAMPQDDETKLGLTQTGEIVGSPLYMSPEQCMAKPVDHRSDIYSMGCLMYESLVGQPPLVGGNVYETFHMQTHERPKPLGEVRAEYKSGTYFEFIILKCMAKNPKHRFQTMEEVKEALARVGVFSSKTTISTIVDTMAYRQVVKRAQQGKSIPTYLTAGITAILIIGAVWLSRDQIRVLIEPPEARYEHFIQQYRIAFDEGDFKNAEKSATSALEIADKERREWLRPVLSYLLDLYRINGKLDQADMIMSRIKVLDAENIKQTEKSEKQLLSKLTELKKKKSDQSIEIEDYCIQLSDLAENYCEHGEFDKARKLLERVANISESSLPGNKLVKTHVQDSLALLRLRDNLAENYDEIATELEQAIEERMKVAGSESSGMIRLLEAYSEVERRRDNLENAQTLAGRALSIARATYRSASIQSAMARCQVAEVAIAGNKYQKALEIIAPAITILDSMPDSVKSNKSVCHNLLGEAKLGMGKYSDALAQFETAADLEKNASDIEVLNLARSLEGIADARLTPELRQPQQAEGRYKRALALSYRSRAREQARMSNLLGKLKQLYNDQQRDDRILPLYEIILKLEKSTGKAPGVIETRKLMALYFRDNQDLDKAARNFEQALEQSQQFYGMRSARSCELMTLLADTYLTMGKPAKAAPLVDESEQIMQDPELSSKFSRKLKLHVLSTIERYLENSQKSENMAERLKKVKESLDSL